ncbi:hypothetical protein A3715_19185 [Oleiphilus sp. HI0009]|nr:MULTISPECIES: thiosulfate sulfurtransferase GlpE [unclassified Oleiphilus]KZX76037.1 hypothetical protein A3715_13775 [Oleiphilus sp. HI0009]MCH2157677.1 thiosulfate sulfurtransferase GlpE [Oleiphilaceae bacterium]KZX80745.1 hypothetical protein A3715_19185 [Oleiphilus sp. HI0009]KZY64986.1 hypothetical protein A3738_09515 [Oleiphilus sp. HI0066]KZY67469.1 hypothetical protein A3739_21710 [Oleiphilus sp. HI0067]
MSFKHLSCAQLASWLSDSENTVTVIDIRDQMSFEQGHINGAAHIDNSNVEHFIANTDLNKPLVVCCYHGNSSQGAADYFNAQGFKETFSLDGGFEEWRQIAATLTTD